MSQELGTWSLCSFSVYVLIVHERASSSVNNVLCVPMRIWSLMFPPPPFFFNGEYILIYYTVHIHCSLPFLLSTGQFYVMMTPPDVIQTGTPRTIAPRTQPYPAWVSALSVAFGEKEKHWYFSLKPSIFWKQTNRWSIFVKHSCCELFSWSLKVRFDWTLKVWQIAFWCVVFRAIHSY